MFENPQLTSQFKILKNEIMHLAKVKDISFDSQDFNGSNKNALKFELNKDCLVSINYEVICRYFFNLYCFLQNIFILFFLYQIKE